MIEETFSSSGACTGATTTNGATATYDPDGRTGGACKLCAASSGEAYLELSGTAPKQGQATFEVHARRVPGASTPASATVQVAVGGTKITSSNGISETWKRVGGPSLTVQSGAAVVFRVGMKEAASGDCVVLDDARVALP